MTAIALPLQSWHRTCFLAWHSSLLHFQLDTRACVPSGLSIRLGQILFEHAESMHARELVEIAGLASFHSDSLIEASDELCDDAMAEYWIASRCRLDHWGRSLRSLAHSETFPANLGKDALLQLAEEIILSGIHTRNLTALCFAHDKYYQRNETTSIARNLLEGHREAETRMLKLTQAWWGRDSPKSRHIRSLVIQSEHWSDIFLAYIGKSVNVDRWAYDVSRVREFAYDTPEHKARKSNSAWHLLAISIRSNFANVTQPACQSELNRRIAGATLSLFSTKLFDSFGLMQSPWMLRAQRSTDETIGMIDQILAKEEVAEKLTTVPRWLSQ